MAAPASPVCGTEAVALLNCVAAKPYDESRCVALLSTLRSCVERKNVQRFAIDGDDKANTKGYPDVKKVENGETGNKGSPDGKMVQKGETGNV